MSSWGLIFTPNIYNIEEYINIMYKKICLNASLPMKEGDSFKESYKVNGC